MTVRIFDLEASILMFRYIVINFDVLGFQPGFPFFDFGGRSYLEAEVKTAHPKALLVQYKLVSTRWNAGDPRLACNVLKAKNILVELHRSLDIVDVKPNMPNS